MTYRPAELIAGESPTYQSAGGVIVVAGAVLLEHRPNDRKVYPDCWDIPGGHLHPGEPPERALVRELHEELGIDVEKVALCTVQDDCEPKSGRLYRHYNYVVRSFRGEVVAREEQTLRWWPIEEALASNSLNPIATFVLRVCVAENWLDGL